MEQKEFYEKLNLLIERISLAETLLEELLEQSEASKIVKEDLKYIGLKIKEANIWLLNVLRNLLKYN